MIEGCKDLGAWGVQDFARRFFGCKKGLQIVKGRRIKLVNESRLPTGLDLWIDLRNGLLLLFIQALNAINLIGTPVILPLNLPGFHNDRWIRQQGRIHFIVYNLAPE